MDEFRTARDFQLTIIEELLVIIDGLNLPKSIFRKQRMFLEEMRAKRNTGQILSKKEQQTLDKISEFFNNLEDDSKLTPEDIKSFIKDLEQDNRCPSLPDELEQCKKNNYKCNITIEDVQPLIRVTDSQNNYCDAIYEEGKRIKEEKRKEKNALIFIVISYMVLFASIAGIVYAVTEDMVAFWWICGVGIGIPLLSLLLNSFQTTRQTSS